MRRGANGPINDDAVSNGPVDLGDVAVTDAYDLDAEYVIHAAAMPHYGNGRASDESIRTAVENTIAKAEELECDSIIVPVIGTGAAGYPFEEGAHTVCETLSNAESTTLTDVRLIAYSRDEYETLKEIAEKSKHADLPTQPPDCSSRTQHRSRR